LFFTINRSGAAATYRQRICKGCEQTKRDQQKEADPWLAKARRTIRTHAQRFGVSETVLVKEYGWMPKIVAHKMEHAWLNGCPRCNRLFRDMPNGTASLTVDVIDPTNYYWLNNTQILCLTCNQEKKDLTPQEDAIIQREWQKWRAEAIPEDPQLSLFDLPPEVFHDRAWQSWSRTPIQQSPSLEQAFLL
jgi:hypothetical protein